jgi:hypothetical protein
LTRAARLPRCALVLVALGACHVNPDDSTRPADPGSSPQNPGAPSAERQSRPPHPPVTHVIARADHLHVVELDTGDFVETPDDDAFEWSFVSKGASLVFEPALGARPGHQRLVAARPGGTQLVIDGDPKCLKVDASCGEPKREWTLFYVVH